VKNRSKLSQRDTKFDTVNRTVKSQVAESTNIYMQKSEKAAKRAENAMQDIEKAYEVKVAKLKDSTSSSSISPPSSPTPVVYEALDAANAASATSLQTLQHKPTNTKSSSFRRASEGTHNPTKKKLWSITRFSYSHFTEEKG